MRAYQFRGITRSQKMQSERGCEINVKNMVTTGVKYGLGQLTGSTGYYTTY